MHPRHSIPLCIRLAIVAASATLAFAGATAMAAQYQWRDGQGRMVYSDLPPPLSVAPERIIRAPHMPRADVPRAPDPSAPDAAATVPVAPVAAAVKDAAATNEAALSVADRDMAYRKRMAENAEQENKAAQASRRKMELAKACSDAQSNIRSLESGQRISRINAAGQTEFLSDAERSERLKTARKSVGERC